jgi:hypothetical protein
MDIHGSLYTCQKDHTGTKSAWSYKPCAVKARASPELDLSVHVGEDSREGRRIGESRQGFEGMQPNEIITMPASCADEINFESMIREAGCVIVRSKDFPR